MTVIGKIGGQATSEHQKWTTAHELAFLDELGTQHTRVAGHIIKPRATLLTNYIRAARRRKDWGGVDKRKALQRAEALQLKAMDEIVEGKR